MDLKFILSYMKGCYIVKNDRVKRSKREIE